jgi:hypothetical protein
MRQTDFAPGAGVVTRDDERQVRGGIGKDLKKT